MLLNKLMSNSVVRRVGALALVFMLLLTTAVPAFAAETEVVEEPTVEVYNIVDEAKAPRQLNVHVGADASTQVNVTYTTVADTATVISVRKAEGGETMYFEGTSYQGLGGKYIHEIVVTDLEAYTEYTYTVGDGFNSYTGTFKTALAQNDKTEFTFAYLADTQVSNAANAEALGATLEAVNEMNPDFVYLAGDVTDKNNNEAQWEWLFNNEGAYPTGGEDMFANSLVAVTQGNHDNNEMYVDGTELVIKELGQDTVEYTVSFDNVLNTNAFQTALEYDASQMELVSAESCLENTIFTDVSNENGVCDVMVGLGAPISADEMTAVVKYTFRLKSDLNADSVSVKLVGADTVQVLTDGEKVDAEDIEATILKELAETIIHSYEKASDINGDGEVTLADLSIALMYYQTAERTCDVNIDGVVNTLDYVIIASYIR